MTSLSEHAESLEAQLAESKQLHAESLQMLAGLMNTTFSSVFGGYDDRSGPSLEQVKEASKRNRDLMALNPHVGNGLELINSYVWGDGVHIEGVPGKKQGKGTNVQALIDDPINQANYFGPLAHKQRQTAFYCDGQPFFYGLTEGSKKTIHPVSIQNITDDYRNPDNDDEIWAYRRTWTRREGTGNSKELSEWIFVSRYEDKRNGRKTLTYKGQSEKIAVEKVMFTLKSNPVVGWAYGLADVQRGISWADDYRAAMADGKSMNSSMASIWATAKNNSTSGANSAAVTAGNMTGAGGLAHIGQNNAMQVLPSAGQVYDFAKLLPILANFAAGIGVSVVALSMNSGNAGGSYGAAKALDRPEQLSTKMRRAYNKELDTEVLLWLGAKADALDIWFDPIIELTEKYRGEQIAELRLGTGLYEGEEVKQMHAVLDGRDPNKCTPVPTGWLIPNNKESIELRTIDPNTSGSAAGGNPANGGGLTPTQGSGAKTNKTGSGDQKADDIRGTREFRLQAALDEMKADELIEAVHALLNKLNGE